jgi:hypothetical protein
MSWMIGSAAEEGDTNIITRVVFKASLRTPKLGVVLSTFWEPVWEIAWDPFWALRIQLGNPRSELLWKIGPA